MRHGFVVLMFVLCAASGFAQSTVSTSSVAAEAAALEKAIPETPGDAELYVRLSQAYAVLNRPAAALDAIEHAVALSPDSIEWLRARATLATWAGDYVRAQDSYRRLAKLAPGDTDLSLNLARVSAWGGRTDAAVEAYTRYLDVHPDSAEAWIELARTEMWRGNYGAALADLEKYQRRFGGDEKYAREMAAVLARAGRPREALEVLDPVLRRHPDDYELNLTRTIALASDHRPRQASASLETLRRLQPNSSDTKSVERVVRNAFASAAEPAVSLYGDSSTLEIQRADPQVMVAFGNGTAVTGGFEHETLRARKGSGLERTNGMENADHDQVWAGAAHQFGALNLHGRVGQARTSVDHLTTYAIGADILPIDGLSVSVERTAGFFVVSPRTVGLGLRQVSHDARVQWSPDLRWVITGSVRYQTMTDDNRRWEFTFSPRYSIARTERLNLDLGFVVSQLGTKTNFDNGYYDPSRYQYYAFTAYPYWKIRESIGLGMSLGLGAQRDDFSPAFRLGGNATAEATIGIYSPWALKVSGGGIFNQRLGSGAFGGYSAGVSLIRRF